MRATVSPVHPEQSLRGNGAKSTAEAELALGLDKTLGFPPGVFVISGMQSALWSYPAHTTAVKADELVHVCGVWLASDRQRHNLLVQCADQSWKTQV